MAVCAFLTIKFHQGVMFDRERFISGSSKIYMSRMLNNVKNKSLQKYNSCSNENRINE